MSWQDRILKPDTSVEQMKQKAALRALEHVRDGMKLGLGTGSTARYFVDGLGAQIAEGMLDVTCVPTSEVTRQQAEGLGIKLASLDDLKKLDLTVDGADELDTALRLIKGGGGALLREKIVAAASAQMIVIADDSKLVDTLGAFDLPVEVNQFSHATTAAAIADALAATQHEGAVALRGGTVSPLSPMADTIFMTVPYRRLKPRRLWRKPFWPCPAWLNMGCFSAMPQRPYWQDKTA